MKPAGSDSWRLYLTNTIRLRDIETQVRFEAGFWIKIWYQVDASDQMFCRSISPARYSDARIDKERIVIVGFCHPALVN